MKKEIRLFEVRIRSSIMEWIWIILWLNSNDSWICLMEEFGTQFRWLNSITKMKEACLLSLMLSCPFSLLNREAIWPSNILGNSQVISSSLSFSLKSFKEILAFFFLVYKNYVLVLFFYTSLRFPISHKFRSSLVLQSHFKTVFS